MWVVECVFMSLLVVSVQFKVLEDEFGVWLFDCSGCGMVLMLVGECLLVEVNCMLLVVQVLQMVVVQICGEVCGVVCMGMVIDLVFLRLGEVFVYLVEWYLQVVLQLQQLVLLCVIVVVCCGELDCVCVLYEGFEIEGLELMCLQFCEIVVVVLFWVVGVGLLVDLVGLVVLFWVMMLLDCGMCIQQEWLFVVVGVLVLVLQMVDNESIVCSMVVSGFGVGLMWCDQVVGVEQVGQGCIWLGWLVYIWFCWISSVVVLQVFVVVVV